MPFPIHSLVVRRDLLTQIDASGRRAWAGILLPKALGRSDRSVRSPFRWIGLVGALLVAEGCAARQTASPAVAADAPTAAPTAERGRLRVRPRAMASGTHTVAAGLQRLDTCPGDSALLRGAFAYVPQRAVGTRRVPLLVFLHGSGMNGRQNFTWDEGILEKFADSAGVILLATHSHSPSGGWVTLADTTEQDVDTPRLDAALRRALHRYAIDPTRIALGGWSAGAGGALAWGLVNGDVFSDVISFSNFTPNNYARAYDHLHRRGTPAIYIGRNGDHDRGDAGYPVFVAWLRQQGYAVTYAPDTGEHYSTARTVAGLMWLRQRWR